MYDSRTDSSLIRNLEHAMGPIAMQALHDPNVLEIMLNPCGMLWSEKFGAPMEHIGDINPIEGRQIVNLVASALSTTITPEHPVVEGELPIDGSRFEGTIYPIVEGPSWTIRKKASKVFTLDEYEQSEIITNNLKYFLNEAVFRKSNILVAGGTGSGKTTLVNALIQSISRSCPDDRIISMEDTYELQVHNLNKVMFRTSNNVDMQNITKIIMRYRPDRIIVGEVRDGAALDLLKAWNTGHSGGIATLHADSALDALGRLEDLIQERIQAPMQRMISRAIHFVVFIQKTQQGRRVTEVAHVNGYDFDKHKYNLEYVFKSDVRQLSEKWYQKYINPGEEQNAA